MYFTNVFIPIVVQTILYGADSHSKRSVIFRPLSLGYSSMLQHILGFIAMPFSSEGITQHKTTSKLYAVMLIPLLLFLGALLGIAIYQTEPPHSSMLIASPIIAIIAGLLLALHRFKTKGKTNKNVLLWAGVVYPLSFIIGVCFVFYIIK